MPREVVGTRGVEVRGTSNTDRGSTRKETISTESVSGAFDPRTQTPTLPNLSDWQNLIGFRPPRSVQRDLSRKLPPWPVHRIEAAWGDISLDYYPVLVSRLPTVNNRRYTAQQLLEHIRINLSDFVDTRIAEFEPYDANNAHTWQSTSYLGTIIHIDMNMFTRLLNPDSGSVVVSEQSVSHWTFSTIWTPSDLNHPVSGNRAFGYETRGSSANVFYTRGADRTTTLLDAGIRLLVFYAADKLWRSLQMKIAEFVNKNSGKALELAATVGRYDWDAVRKRYYRPTTDWLPTPPNTNE